MKFVKMHGAGNDYIYIDARNMDEDWPLLAQLLAQNDTAKTVTLVVAIIGILVVGFILIIFFAYFRLWIQAVLTGANITIGNLLGMTFRKVNPKIIVQSKIMATQAGFTDEEFTTSELEGHLLAGGNVPLVVRALIAARKAKTIKLSYREATAIDLAGRNVLEAVQTSVYPKVIDCPARDSGKKTLDAVAKDGILVNTICPGLTNTQRARTLQQARADKEGLSVEEILQALGSRLPAGRIAEPQEVAQMVAFLASECCSYMFGSSLYMDGGERRGTP